MSARKELKARDCMSAPVYAVRPDDPARRAAELMIAHRVSGLPVIDAAGAPVGMVSEADFIFGDDEARRARHERWLRTISDGQSVNPDYLALLDHELGAVRQFMATPVVSVDENAPLADVIVAMAERRIRRIAVTRQGKLVGVITRRDLLRATAGPVAEPLPVVDDAPQTARPAPARLSPAPSAAPSAGGEAAPALDEPFSASALRALVARHAQSEQDLRRHAAEDAVRRRDAAVQEMLAAPLAEGEWRGLLNEARLRAAQGETQMVLLRFPAALCEDGGRAVNAPDPDWPATLRGKAARVYLRWREELKPQGFRLTAQIVSFPNGLPGDVEITLAWGG